MAPLLLETLRGLAIHNTTNTTTTDGLTLYRRQMFPIPPPFIPPHWHGPSDHSGSPSTGPRVGGEFDFTAATSIGLRLYAGICLAAACQVTNRWNSHKHPHPPFWVWMLQLCGFVVILFFTLPLLVLHAGLQILVRAFLRCAGVPAAAGSSRSVSTVTRQNDVERQEQDGTNNANNGGNIICRVLVKYIGLHPLRQGTPSWAEQNHAESLRRSPEGGREPRRSARSERQVNEEIAQLESELAPLPAYDGAVLPPYGHAPYGTFAASPVSIRQGEMRRDCQGDFVRQSLAGHGDIADQSYASREMQSPPPSYRSPRRAPGGPLSLC
ncbi:hypothetical protein PG987_012138 [Apiospora arundinis]